MPSLLQGFEYDIFISYRQKDNKYDGWITEFVSNLKKELEATFKEDISVYFDINPHDGLLETHDVDASLKDKLKCLVFIPIISRTYCDPKSFAWVHEFKTFIEQASLDQFGLKVKLPNGNVANRILPVQIHDLDPDDKKLIESELGGFLRGIEFIYKESGVNRPLMANEDHPDNNLCKTFYRNQVNKVANAVKEIITAIKKHNQLHGEVHKEVVKIKPEKVRNLNPKIIITSIILIVLLVPGYLFISKLFKSELQIEKSVAVLPFRNDSPVDSNKYFINGIMEDILNDLQSIKDLRVISRTSAEKYRNTTKSIPEIAKELGVNYIVEGSGQKSGNVIHLSVQLLRSRIEGHLWGKSYEQELHNASDIFRIENQIAMAIAEEIQAVITPQEKELVGKAPTEDLAAYEDYIQGNNYLKKFTRKDFETALQYFEKAKDKDPGYALAYVGMCFVWIDRILYSYATPEEAASKAIAAFTKAYELDSNRAEVYNCLENIQSLFKYDWKGAELSILKAISLNPNNVDSHNIYAGLLIIEGRMEEAIKQSELALKLDPINPASKATYGLVLLFAHKYDDAIMTFKEVLKTDPFHDLALGNLPEALHQVGKYEEELEAWKSYLSSSSIFQGFVHVIDAGYARGGLNVALNLEADTLVSQSQIHYINPFEVALIFACAGNKKRTLDLLELDYDVHDFNLPFALNYPVFDFVHDEPRFREISSKMNLPVK